MICGANALASAYLGEGKQRAVLAVDASGNGRHGIYIGALGLGQPGALIGEQDTASLFAASSDYVYVGDPNSFSFTSNIFSFEWWFKPTVSSNSEGILGKRGNPWEYSIFRIGAGLFLKAWNATGTEVYAASYNISDLNYHYYCWAADGSNARLYTDVAGTITLVSTVAKSGASMANTFAPLILALGGDFDAAAPPTSHPADLTGSITIMAGIGASMNATMSLSGTVTLESMIEEHSPGGGVLILVGPGAKRTMGREPVRQPSLLGVLPS